MQRAEGMSMEQMRGFLPGSGEVEITAAGAREIYPWVERLLEGESTSGRARRIGAW